MPNGSCNFHRITFKKMNAHSDKCEQYLSTFASKCQQGLHGINTKCHQKLCIYKTKTLVYKFRKNIISINLF